VSGRGAQQSGVSVVEGEILALDEGSRAKRCLFGAGAARVSIHGRVLDSNGTLIGEFIGEHQIASGKFGGESEYVLRSTIHGVAEDFADHVATGRY